MAVKLEAKLPTKLYQIKVHRVLHQVPKVYYRDLEKVKAQRNDLSEVTDALKLGKMEHVDM